MRFSAFLFLAGATGLLCQCAAPPLTPEENAVAERRRMPGIDTRRLDRLQNGDLSQIHISILRSPELEKRWGKPVCVVDTDGGYRLTYQNPKTRFQTLYIYGSPAAYSPAGPVPPEYSDLYFPENSKEASTRWVPQEWRTVGIAGMPVRYCLAAPDSGADVAEFTTETFTLAGPDGRVGSYCLSASTNRNEGNTTITSFFQTAGF